jgi:hypothetical protein
MVLAGFPATGDASRQEDLSLHHPDRPTYYDADVRLGPGGFRWGSC